ncbi:transglutaminase-like domain-containing protein [Actinomyces capricornis]|uniref:Cysteine protease n=1 Tax=Actinomyces capricornis TaxID=2755559 RepID=A0ABN6K306_9ACTO|nr:transglutaminase-like domain-containing protein [Actinomyces capricornis]BDA63953.1 cysteine protease [Actinomyces capricornis]
MTPSPTTTHSPAPPAPSPQAGQDPRERAPRSASHSGETTRRSLLLGPHQRLALARASRPPLPLERFLARRTAPTPPSRPAAALELLIIVVVLALGMLPFLPAFGTTSGYTAGLMGAATGLVVILGCSALRLSALPTIAALGVAHAALAPLLLPDVGSGLPAVGAVLSSTVTVWRDSLNVPLPLSSFAAMTTLPWLIGLIVSALAARLVLLGRDVLAGLAVALAPAAAIAWGGQSAVLPAVTGPALAAGVLALWSCASLRRRRSRVAEALSAPAPGGPSAASARQGLDQVIRRGALSSTAVVAMAAALALAVAPTVPSTRMVLRDLFEPPLDLTEYATPLSLVRSIETDMAGTELLSLSGAPEGVRVRVAALDSYDGLAARIGEDSGGASRFERVGEHTVLAEGGAEASQEVRLEVEGYSFPWVPTVSRTVMLRASGPRAAALRESMYFDAFSSTGIATAGMVQGDVLTQQVDPYSAPSENQLDNATLARISLGTVEQVPASVAALAQEIVGSESDPLAQIRALQQRLRTSYYSDGTQSKSDPGHGASRIARMAEAESLVGDDEQYPVLMMLMCRSLGIPARVVMGFDPATDGDATTVTGEDIKGWVEIPFEELGWVAFDITPDRDQVPQQQTTQQVSNPEPQVLQPPLPMQDPAELPPSYEDPDNDEPQDDPPGGVPLGVYIAAGAAAALLALLGAILGWKALRRLRRRRRPGVEQALGAWDEIVDRARDLGTVSSWGATRREAAAEMSGHFPRADLSRFAHAVDSQVFSAGEPAAYALGELWDSCDAIVRAMGADRSWLRRSLARLSLRSLAHPAGREPRRRPPRRLRS